jgi:hypothetical protein
MTRIAKTSKLWRFALDEREKDCLELVLQSYPAIPRAHQPLSRHTAEGLDAEDTALLDEALEDQRQAHRNHLQRWWRKPGRLRQQEDTWELEVPVSDLDWLLQVLNDVRVGQWIRLGAPETIDNPLALLKKDGKALFLMELAGMFQMTLLEAGEDTADPPTTPD